MNRATVPPGVMRGTEKEPYLRRDNARCGAAGRRFHRDRLTGADASRKSVAGNAAARAAGGGRRAASVMRRLRRAA